MSSSGIHPGVTSIIKKRDTIYNLLYLERNYRSAVDNMMGLLYELKPTDQKKNESLIQEIKKEIYILSNNKSDTATKLRTNNLQNKYKEWLRKINDILWTGKYYDNQKYGWYDITKKTTPTENDDDDWRKK